MTTEPTNVDRDFSLLIRAESHDGLELLRLPEDRGGAPEPFTPPFPPSEIEGLLAQLEATIWHQAWQAGQGVRGDLRTVALEGEETPPQFDLGDLPQRLHRALFPPGISNAYNWELGAAHQVGGAAVRLRLVMDPGDPRVGPLCSIPWELATPEGQATALALDPLRTLVRALVPERPLAQPPRWPTGEPLRVLLAGASPPGSPPLDLEGERKAILCAGDGHALPSFEVLSPATLGNLRRRLQEYRPHVLHLASHGDFHPETGRGLLILAAEDYGDDRVEAHELARMLAGLPELRLVVLNACNGAQFNRRRGLDAWSGMAQTLVREGMPAVLAHQFPISDRAAVAFSGGLYGRLMAGSSLEAAVAEGRQAISLACRGTLEWATPVLYTRLFAGDQAPSSGPRVTSSLKSKLKDQSSLIASKTAGFVGRNWFFERLERLRSACKASPQGGYFVVYGDPGVGKTALLSEVVRRHGCVHHFNVRRQVESQVGVFLENTCAQLILRWGLPYAGLPAETTRDGGVLGQIMHEVSARRDPKAPVELLAIDALDEADSVDMPDANPLFLPPFLPPGIVVLLSSQRLKREPELRCALDKFDMKEYEAENLADAKAHLQERSTHPKIREFRAAKSLSESTFVEQLLDRSEGNFMYLHYVLSELEVQGAKFPDLSTLPGGLAGYYESHWSRMQGRDDREQQQLKVQILLALAIATEPISIETIADYSGVPDPRLIVPILREWRPFLDRSVDADEDGRFYRYRVYHDSFRTFLRSREEVDAELVSFERAHRRAMQHLATTRREDGA